MKLNSYLKQKYPKGIEDPNMRAKTTKFLEENSGVVMTSDFAMNS